MSYEFYGSVTDIRAVEDCIRATKKYTEGLETRRQEHPTQGDDFPSRVFYKRYDVYPDLDIGLDTPIGEAFRWMLGKYKSIDVGFRYDYLGNRAKIVLRDGKEAVKTLSKSIPGFSKALGKAIARTKNATQETTSTATDTAQNRQQARSHAG